MDFLNYLKPEKVERVVSILKLRMPDWDTLSTEEKDHAKNLLTLDMIADVAFTTAIETELHSLRDLTVANEMFSAQDAANFREYEGQVDSGMLDRDAQTNLMADAGASQDELKRKQDEIDQLIQRMRDNLTDYQNSEQYGNLERKYDQLKEPTPWKRWGLDARDADVMVVVETFTLNMADLLRPEDTAETAATRRMLGYETN